MKQILSVANIIVFILAAVISFVAALVVLQFGGDKLSAVLTSVAAGIVATMLIGGLAEALKWNLGSSPVAGAIGALVGMGAVYLFL